MSVIGKTAILLISLVLQLLSIQLSAQDADSLLQVVCALPDNAERLKAIDTLCQVHPSVDTVEKYALMEIALARKLQMPYFEASANDNMSWVCYCKLDFMQSLEHRMAAIQIWDSLGRESDLAFSYMNYATTLMSIKSYVLADEYYQSSFEIYSRLCDTARMSRVCQYLGFLNIGNMAYDNADEYYWRALDLNVKTGNRRGMVYDYSGLGYSAVERFHNHEKDTNMVLLQTAKQLLTKSFELAESIGDLSGQLSSLPKLSEVYNCEAKLDSRRSAQLLDSSLHYYQIGMKIVDDFGYDFAYIDLRIAYINYLIQKKMYAKARAAIDETEAEILAHDGGDDNLPMLYQARIDYNVAVGNYAEAYRYSEQKYTDLVAENTRNNQYKLTQTKFMIDYSAKINKRMMEERERELMHKIKEQNQRRIIIGNTVVLVLVSVLAVFFFFTTKRRKRMNAVLDAKNQQLATAQSNLVEQNRIIIQANYKITSSIRYARHIQDMAMPTEAMMESVWGKCLILFRPRDIVSGDFYWTMQIGRFKALAVADCTGHGVPGAFLSILGISMLNDLVASANMNSSETTAAKLLNELRTKIRISLRQKSDDYTNQDGMDIALCLYDTQLHNLQYAGAFRPLLLARSGEIIQYEADRMPIGAYMLDTPFTNNIIDIETGDIIYVYTDGITDQFGADDLKFTAPRLRELICNNCLRPFVHQRSIIEKAIDDWRTIPQTGEMTNQTDDMLLVGVRFLE